MYTGNHVNARPLQPAFIMASTGETVTYRELDARSNRLAHLLRNRGLKRLDHFSIFMENNSRYLEACGAGERAGLYFTCVNSYLTPSELAYILDPLDYPPDLVVAVGDEGGEDLDLAQVELFLVHRERVPFR